MITSKPTSAAQTTIPQPVRAALGLEVGDEVAYEIQDERVILTRAKSGAVGEDPVALFDEGDSDASLEPFRWKMLWSGVRKSGRWFSARIPLEQCGIDPNSS